MVPVVQNPSWWERPGNRQDTVPEARKLTGNIPTHTQEGERNRGKWGAGKGSDKKLETHKVCPSDVLPSARLHLLKVPQPLEAVLPVDDEGFIIYLSPWEVSHIQTTVGEGLSRGL